MGEIDFYEGEFDERPDYKSNSRRELEVWYNGEALTDDRGNVITIHAYSRAQADGYLRSKSNDRFPRDSESHELGTWQRKRENDILLRDEQRRRNQISEFGKLDSLGGGNGGAIVNLALKRGYANAKSDDSRIEILRKVSGGGFAIKMAANWKHSGTKYALFGQVVALVERYLLSGKVNIDPGLFYQDAFANKLGMRVEELAKAKGT